MTREELIFLLEMNTRYSRGYLEGLSDEELKKRVLKHQGEI